VGADDLRVGRGRTSLAAAARARTFVETITRGFRVAMDRLRGRKFWICHAKHEHDRTYTENVCEFLGAMGVKCQVLEFENPGNRPELQQCLGDHTIAILGINSQLDHCWIDEANFVEVAARQNVQVIHWILDHPSSRWPEFTHATAENSKFLFMSEFSERYFRRYCLPDASTASVAGHGPNWRSRIDTLSRRSYLERAIPCLIPLNVRRIGGTLEDAQARLKTLDLGLSAAVEEAIALARFNLDDPIEVHLNASLARRSRDLTNPQFHFCFQIVDETVQIWRRLRVFEIASKFPVFIQTDAAPISLLSGAAASFSYDPQVNSMPATIARMKSCRAVVNCNYANDMLHDRTENGLNAGCVSIVEDTPIHRRLFRHGENALLFRHDDDSLAECLDLVCNRPDRAFEIAQAGLPGRDDPAIRFGGYQNFIDLA
jgi:hypothetical protein